MANVIQCDRCKAIAATEEAHNNYTRIRIFDYGHSTFDDIDLCPNCKDKFDEFLNGGQNHDVNEI